MCAECCDAFFHDCYRTNVGNSGLGNWDLLGSKVFHVQHVIAFIVTLVTDQFMRTAVIFVLNKSA